MITKIQITQLKEVIKKMSPKKWRIGFDDDSGSEYIVTYREKRPDCDNQDAILTCRWGCSCCKNTPASIDDLTEEEFNNMGFICFVRNHADEIVKALEQMGN